MKLKLSAALSAAVVLGLPTVVWADVVPGDAGAVTPAMVNDIAHLKGPAAIKPRTGRGKASPRLSRPQALALARSENPQLFAGTPTRALQLPPGAKLQGYINDFSAQVDVAGHDVIAQSTMPLRVTKDGAQRPVATSLANPRATLVPAPSGTGRVLVVTSYLFGSRAGTGEGGELVYYFQEP